MMEEPEYILEGGTRVRTNKVLSSTGGFLVAEKHMEVRKPDTVGVITGIVGGHGGDVYWVAQIGDPCLAAYGWMEFELEPVKDPCPACEGTGIDWSVSKVASLCTACAVCHGGAERQPDRPTAWERL